jgi:hypothetical protein
MRAARPNATILPEHLRGLFPTFSTWLKNHVQRLRRDDFPIPTAMVNLSCAPDPVAWSFQSMWAYGAHYRCDTEEDGPANVTFDSGIAHITEEMLNSKIDVGILKCILMVTFGSMNCVVIEGSWVAQEHEHCTNVKKDKYGFWTVGFDN